MCNPRVCIAGEYVVDGPDSKLTILYNSNPTAQPPPSESVSRHAIDSGTVGLSARDTGRLSRFLASCAEPMSVRVGTWHSLETRLGRLEFWCGPVLKQRWRPDRQPEFTVGSPRCVYGVGFRAYLFWGETRKGFSAVCMPAGSSGSPGLTSLRLNFSFPRIVVTHADIFEFISTENLPAIQHMFSTHQATPWDTTPSGRGLLHVCQTPSPFRQPSFFPSFRMRGQIRPRCQRQRVNFHQGRNHNGFSTCRGLSHSPGG